MTLNRHQDCFDLYFADPRSTLCKLMPGDESPYYIKENIFDQHQFYPEYFSMLSQTADGYSHLYWYSMGGNPIKKVTNGKFEVKDFLGYDEEDGGKKPNCLNRQEPIHPLQQIDEVLYEQVLQLGYSYVGYLER